MKSLGQLLGRCSGVYSCRMLPYRLSLRIPRLTARFSFSAALTLHHLSPFNLGLEQASWILGLGRRFDLSIGFRRKQVRVAGAHGAHSEHVDVNKRILVAKTVPTRHIFAQMADSPLNRTNQKQYIPVTYKKKNTAQESCRKSLGIIQHVLACLLVLKAFVQDVVLPIGGTGSMACLGLPRALPRACDKPRFTNPHSDQTQAVQLEVE